MTTRSKRDDVLKVIVEAREKGTVPDLYYADLRGADLRGANLIYANLRGADLYGANLRDADLRGANLHAANLSYANLHDTNLHDTNLYGANLHAANLSYANLIYANLRDADLHAANLHAADLRGAIWYGLYLNGMRSGDAIHVPTSGGWQTSVGCWTGTLDELEALISGNVGWPEAKGEECDRRRPELIAFIALARAHEAYHSEAVDEIRRARGGDKA